MVNSIEQKLKGDGNTQNNITVNGNVIMGVSEEKVLEMINVYCYTCKDQIIEIVREAIENVKDENRVAPDKRIFVPAIQNLSYSMDDTVIKETYKKLLKSSMDVNQSGKVHPSFLSIINQLNSDEVKILNLFPTEVSINKPLISMRAKIEGKKGDGFLIVSNFTDIGYGVCDNPHNISGYIDNLERLKLIEIPPYGTLIDKEIYNPLKNHPAIQIIVEENSSQHLVTEFDERYFRLTQFGRQFLECCVK